jgi:hypothetical protein
MKELLDKVSELNELYKDNEIIHQKLVNYILNILPETLETTNNTLKKREERKSTLENESEKFVQRFLNNNKYYYHSTSELFFEYKENKYTIVKEDDVQHTILKSISENKVLMDWKYKLKVSILKKIKERDIFTCIPESETIQKVITKLNPLIFVNKETAKYFLTVLGDIILKKSSLIYFVNSSFKPWLKEISNLCCMLFGTPNLFNIFKFKFYDHKYEDCRILYSQSYIELESWNNYFKQENALNLFCVAAHYSQRFKSADNFILEKCKDKQLQDYTFFLKNNTKNEIMEKFINNSCEKVDNCKISLKNMMYLWKQFVENEKIPNVFFNNQLKQELIEKLEYDVNSDSFLNITSSKIPVVSQFISLFSTNIEEDMDEEIEIDEICSLFNNASKLNLSEKEILDLIRHFFPDMIIEDDKYILNSKCKLWDKKKDIIEFLKNYKQIAPHVEIYSEEVPINEMYQIYCSSKNKYIASKRYFEKFIKNYSELYIVEENFIKVKSFDNI